MKIRVIQWNISTSSKPQAIASFIEDRIKSYTVVNLQEVTANAHNKIIDTLKPSDSVYSLHLRKPGKYEERNRRMGVSTLVFNGRIENFSLLERTIFPERTLDVRLLFGSESIHIINFHSLTGVGYHKAKPSNFAAIADYLDYYHNDLDFFTCDANEPKVDTLNDDEIEFWNRGDKGKKASLLFGKSKVHNLKDAFKVYLDKKGNYEDKNPLAVSHMTKGVPRRYDFIYASKKWEPTYIEYSYEKSIKSTSDHSMVMGEFVSNV